VGRIPIYVDSTKIGVSGKTAKSRLQPGSERRAIIDKVIDSGGTTTIRKLEEHFGYDLKGKIGALVRIGWLAVME